MNDNKHPRHPYTIGLLCPLTRPKNAGNMSCDEQVLIQVKALKKYFPIQPGIFQRHVGNVKVVDDVTYDILKGETLGLVCKSGCGKTIVGGTALQVYRVTTGRVQCGWHRTEPVRIHLHTSSAPPDAEDFSEPKRLAQPTNVLRRNRFRLANVRI